MIARLKKIYKAEQFNPTFIGIFINPFFFARRGLYNNISALIPNLNGILLDIGCGTKPYESICSVDRYIGLEIDDGASRQHSYADLFYDGDIIPMEDKSCDSLLSNQVFEHVFNPNKFLSEINRVMKIDGYMLMSVPFVWDEHEQPYDYARYSSYGMRYILKEHGFDIVELRKSNNGVEVIFQLINAYIYKVFFTKNIYINLFLTLILIAPSNIVGLLLSRVLPKNDDLYLDNIILARKVKDV